MLLDAEKIKGMRLENGWTQDQLAQMCDVSIRTVQRSEKTGVASLETASALAAVFKTERKTILAHGGVQPARTEFSLKHVCLIATATLLLGIGIGVIV